MFSNIKKWFFGQNFAQTIFFFKEPHWFNRDNSFTEKKKQCNLTNNFNWSIVL